MAKYPAFLFYPGDWMGGTMTFTREQKGAYMDLLIAQFNNGRMSLHEIRNVLGEVDYKNMWDDILRRKFKKDVEGKYYNERLELEAIKRQNYTESRRKSRLKADEDSVRIYIVRDNVRKMYKIGSSVNPTRRYNELSNQSNPAIMFDGQGNRDLKLLWYSEICERKMEAKIHKHFDNKRVAGEWFNLDDGDISWIKIFLKE